MSYNPDPNLMDSQCPKGCTWYECGYDLKPGTTVCVWCGLDGTAPRQASPIVNNQQALGAQVANILSAADRAQSDAVNLPAHYARFKIEPMHFIVENGLNWFQGNVLKYILRYDAKNGMEDLRKAQRYLEMFIKWVDGDPDWWRHPSRANGLAASDKSDGKDWETATRLDPQSPGYIPEFNSDG